MKLNTLLANKTTHTSWYFLVIFISFLKPFETSIYQLLNFCQKNLIVFITVKHIALPRIPGLHFGNTPLHVFRLFYVKILDILCEAIYLNWISFMHCLYYFIYFRLIQLFVARTVNMFHLVVIVLLFVCFLFCFLQKFCVKYYMPAHQTNMFCPIKRTNIQLT